MRRQASWRLGGSWLAVTLLVAVVLPRLLSAQSLGASSHPTPAEALDLSLSVGALDVERRPGEEPMIVVPTSDGTMRMTADEFLDAIDENKTLQRERGWLYVFMNISSPIGLAWIGLGLAGQVLFAGRMIVQWIISEKQHRSVVPLSFWWMSLGGASMLIVYFIWRRDAVGVLGQATGWFIYIRNLWMIYTTSQPEAVSSELPHEDASTRDAT